MNFDKNTLIGFIVMGVLFAGYFFYISKEQNQFKIEQARLDSIANAQKPKMDPRILLADSLKADSLSKVISSGDFAKPATTTEEISVVENDLIKIAFTNKGAIPKWVQLKKFQSILNKPVVLAADPFNSIQYEVNTGSQQSTSTLNLFFAAPKIHKLENGNIEVVYSLGTGDSGISNSRSIQHKYTVRPLEYLIDFDILLHGASQLTSQNQLKLSWNYVAEQQESDPTFESQNTQIGYLLDGKFDYHTIGRKSHVDFSKPVQWVGVRQRFFNTFLIAKNNFASGEVDWKTDFDTAKNKIVQTMASLKLNLPSAATSVTVPLQIFYGPSDLNTLAKYNLKLDEMVNLGQGMYAFVRPLNRYVILPVWDFIKKFVNNFGWVIAFLTLFIRLLISPLTYRSYLSGAKMKALKPEIAKLKEKLGTDQQAMSMEQMKLFREAGVNPLGGCIPALFQIPIFFALYSFFNSSVDLRGANFLWANDLSAYDQILHFGFKIPFLGSHLSLFTVTATITSLLISLYSMSLAPDQSNPMMKYMPYIFPVFLLFIFNNLPSALTWYYTVSNIITLVLQFVIQNYIINHGKILAQIVENRTKPKPKSKWAERLEQMQVQQKKIQDTQNKNKK